ncbi:MFS transporter [Mangrovimicrobium sediminis]|uniref:MFS transporter n=1 Tax=Mangrovimicrobium sediminis TaxID=2562682 RepID=A0A4Z0LYI2_9GAMM|nr:MFS transporter [Haliea sp. SAOS-164]TGD72236.1 MFS transporter [Haliea sp. SAOS-164]
MSYSIQSEEAHKASALTVVSGATMLALVVFTVPLTSLAPSAESLAAGPALQAWILSGMPLGAAAGLLGAGSLGDNHSRRAVFLWGLAILVAASALGALAPTGLVLVAARIIQGLGSAAVLACGLGLLGQVFRDEHERTRATGIWAAALGAGVACGPILAALLTAFSGWRAAYAGTAWLALALLLAGRNALPATQVARTGRFDWAGAVLLLAGLSALMSGLTQSRLGWAQPTTLLLLCIGGACLAAFVLVEIRHQQPVLDFSLFRYPDFVGATVAAFASGAGVLALMTLVPTLLQRSMHVGALLAALVLLAWSVTSVVTALGSRWLLVRHSPRILLTLGLVACGVAQLMLIAPQPDASLLPLLPALVLAGAANGVLNAALGKQAVSSVPAHLSAMGSGANNTARYLGSAIGITLGAVLIAHGEEAGAAPGLLWGWDQAVSVTASFSLLGALVVMFSRERVVAVEQCCEQA